MHSGGFLTKWYCNSMYDLLFIKHFLMCVHYYRHHSGSCSDTAKSTLKHKHDKVKKRRSPSPKSSTSSTSMTSTSSSDSSSLSWESSHSPSSKPKEKHKASKAKKKRMYKKRGKKTEKC